VKASHEYKLLYSWKFQIRQRPLWVLLQALPLRLWCAEDCPAFQTFAVERGHYHGRGPWATLNTSLESFPNHDIVPRFFTKIDKHDE